MYLNHHTSPTVNFQVHHAVDYGMEDPQPGYPRGTSYEFIQEFDTYIEAEEFAESYHEGDFDRLVLFAPQWFKDIERQQHQEALDRSNREANDPSHPNYAPF